MRQKLSNLVRFIILKFKIKLKKYYFKKIYIYKKLIELIKL